MFSKVVSDCEGKTTNIINKVEFQFSCDSKENLVV